MYNKTENKNKKDNNICSCYSTRCYNSDFCNDNKYAK